VNRKIFGGYGLMVKKIPLLVKIVLIHIIFVLLHYLYDWFPNDFTAIFSGINESVYQHMKIGFFSYIVFALIEYAITRKSITKFRQYFFSRLFSATYLPLVMMVIYLFGPLVFGHVDNIGFEIVFANIALLATSFTTLIVEGQVAKSEPGKVFRFVTIALFVLSFFQFIVFTYNLPWFDIFAIPPGY
jgi:hypothetical protein